MRRFFFFRGVSDLSLQMLSQVSWEGIYSRKGKDEHFPDKIMTKSFSSPRRACDYGIFKHLFHTKSFRLKPCEVFHDMNDDGFQAE